MEEEEFFQLKPASFFEVVADIPEISSSSDWEKSLKKKGHLLPDTSMLTGDPSFADVYLGWNRDGLYFLCEVHSPFKDVFYPDVTRGDSVELFIDTRDNKTSSYNTKFCHHFYFLPKEIDGNKAGEKTKFRGEESHEWTDSKELHLLSDLQRKGYKLQIFIPSTSLFGFDPEQFNRLGFNYRINRHGEKSQHFSSSSDEYMIEQQPATWASLNLCKIV